MYRWQFLKSYDCYKEENNCKCFIFAVYVTGCAAETMQCVKSVQEVFSSPYSVRMRENTDKIKLRIWTLFMSWWSQYFQRVYCIGQALQRNAGLKWANLELNNRGHSKEWKTSKNQSGTLAFEKKGDCIPWFPEGFPWIYVWRNPEAYLEPCQRSVVEPIC